MKQRKDSLCKKIIACTGAVVIAGTCFYTGVRAMAAEANAPKDNIATYVEVQSQEVVSLNYDEKVPQAVGTHIVETQYDKSIFTENGIEFHYIAGDTWQGTMMVIKDASRVFVGMPRESYTGAPGANATVIAKRYGALAAVNGAFFVDTNQVGNGGTPIGFVFSEGKQTYGGSGSSFNIIGLDQNNQMVCGVMTGAQAVSMGVRDAVTCNPILVQDGKIGNLSTKNTTLRDARTAIGVRADGAFLILTMDGRMAHSIGATTMEEAEVMLAFGAVGAGNLDGGGSLSFYYGGSPIDGLSSAYGSRPVPNAICVRPE